MWIFNSKVFGFDNPFEAFFHAQLYIKILDNQALMGDPRIQKPHG